MQRQNKQIGKSGGSPPGRLRIVAGKWRSRLLPVADVPGLRPTSERLRETLFNWLAPTIEGTKCLDLFAGTGALGLEALSRGASSVDFVEISKVAATALCENIQTLNATNTDVHQANAMTFLDSEPPTQYDTVFLDPPFATDSYQELCRLLASHNWLAKGAHIYLEQDSSQQVPDLPEGWNLLKEKTTGNVRYSLIRT